MLHEKPVSMILLVNARQTTHLMSKGEARERRARSQRCGRCDMWRYDRIVCARSYGWIRYAVNSM